MQVSNIKLLINETKFIMGGGGGVRVPMTIEDLPENEIHNPLTVTNLATKDV